jgi:hypothetical protein
VGPAAVVALAGSEPAALGAGVTEDWVGVFDLFNCCCFFARHPAPPPSVLQVSRVVLVGDAMCTVMLTRPWSLRGTPKSLHQDVDWCPACLAQCCQRVVTVINIGSTG